MNWGGILLGGASFVIIGVLHPIVIRAEYRFGKNCWPACLIAGLALAVAVILIIDLFINSAMCFAANHWFKLMCLALCACTLVYIGAGRIK